MVCLQIRWTTSELNLTGKSQPNLMNEEQMCKKIADPVTTYTDIAPRVYHKNW